MKISFLSLQVASDTLLFQLELITLFFSHLQMNAISQSQSLTQSDQIETDKEEKLSEDDF